MLTVVPTDWWCQNSLLIDAAEVEGGKKPLLLLTMDGGLELPQFNDKPVKSINPSIIQGLINLWVMPLSSPVLPWYLLLDYFLKHNTKWTGCKEKRAQSSKTWHIHSVLPVSAVLPYFWNFIFLFSCFHVTHSAYLTHTS